MMDQAVTDAVRKLHAAPGKVVLYVTGGGTSGLSWLQSQPGASRTLVEAVVPYAPESLEALLGSAPAQAVSAETVRAMAAKAFDRAIELGVGPREAAGLAVTAALKTDRPRKGEHHIIIAGETVLSRVAVEVRLEKDRRSRPEEEAVAGRLLIRALALLWGVASDVPLGLADEERLDESLSEQRDPLIRLAGGIIPYAVLHANGSLDEKVPLLPFLLPGSFNPAHAGHVGLFRAAETFFDETGGFEVSLKNVDKPMLAPGLARRRAEALIRHGPVIFTIAPTFVEKAVLFPGKTFAVGYDTAARILDPAYYGGGEGGLETALRALEKASASFLVAGRLVGEVFRTVRDLRCPAPFAGLFKEIPEAIFRMDVSSTEIRAGCH